MPRQKWRGNRGAVLAAVVALLVCGLFYGRTSVAMQAPTDPIVFVERQIPADGSAYYTGENGMPGVGPFDRVRSAGPGRLLLLDAASRIRVLVDGNNPTAASLFLRDVNAPEVSYDGQRIVFAGLPQGNYDTRPNRNLNAWRIYEIRVDGSGLRQITTSSGAHAQPGLPGLALNGFDDFDPAYLPDGRIVFSSTRWPSFAHYSGVRTTNLYVVNADASNLHRITAERNGAERATVDPLTGKIVYSRWWRNHRTPIDSLTTIAASGGGFIQRDGLCGDPPSCQGRIGGQFAPQVWTLTSINPDGTGLELFSGYLRNPIFNHTYGCAFSDSGEAVCNFFPMANMTEASGFGGIRRYPRGPGLYQHLLGVTTTQLPYYCGPPACSQSTFGIHVSAEGYAGEPEFMRDGRLLVSRAATVQQDYGLWIRNTDGSLQLLYDRTGTSELQAKVVRARPLPPVVPDSVATAASLLPPSAAGPYNIDGSYTFDALNVYFNAPVDADVINAMTIGSGRTISFFADFQRTSPGSFPLLDWPILLDQRTISPAGRITTTAPANIPLFEQVRDGNNRIPLTTSINNANRGAAHVAGHNFGRPGQVQRCVGCHVGHTQIAIPTDFDYTNLAPSATVTGNGSNLTRLNDRRALKDPNPWNGTNASLTFPVPIRAKALVFYGAANVTAQLINGSTIVGTVQGVSAPTGNRVSFNPVVITRVNVVRSGGLLRDIEVIASGNVQ